MQPWRHWSAEEKRQSCRSPGPGISVSRWPCRHCIAPQSAVSLAASLRRGCAFGGGRWQKKMLPRLRIPGLAEHVREPQRLLDKKMSENEILRTVLDLAQPRTPFAFALTPAGRHAMKTITDASEWRARTSSLRQPLLHRAVAGVSPKLTSLSQLFRHVRC